MASEEAEEYKYKASHIKMNAGDLVVKSHCQQHLGLILKRHTGCYGQVSACARKHSGRSVSSGYIVPSLWHMPDSM